MRDNMNIPIDSEVLEELRNAASQLGEPLSELVRPAIKRLLLELREDHRAGRPFTIDPDLRLPASFGPRWAPSGVKVTAETAAKMRELRARGKPLSEIARRFRVAQTTVWNHTTPRGGE